MKDIKSVFVLRKIFNHLSDRSIFRIVKYNKDLSHIRINNTETINHLCYLFGKGTN